ncbi:MAG: carboxylating nicotinate-nucleotide diphosphorylase [Anaerolineales bacterium]
MNNQSIQSRLERAQTHLPIELQQPQVLNLLQMALAEDLTEKGDLASLGADLTAGDITSTATIDETTCLMAYIRAKEAGVVAGLPVARAVFSLVDPEIFFEPMLHDGEIVQAGTMLVELSGRGRALLAGERTALNFLGRLSGIASLTHQLVEAVKGTSAVILDTRKTAPGWRLLDKYAVRCGGGQNHRTGLFDMLLIKDNHISGAGGISAAVERARERYGNKFGIEVEVKNLEELEEALGLGVERIMLDNMNLETMRIAVKTVDGRIPLEASGNVSLENVVQIAETGVDYISSGALTHSTPALDISMKIG